MTHTIKLTYPIKGDDQQEIKEVTLRRPKVGDMVAAEQAGQFGTIAYAAGLAASVVGVSFHAFQELDALDLTQISNAVEEMMGNGQPAAGADSPS